MDYAQRNGLHPQFRRRLMCFLMDAGENAGTPRSTVHSACALADRHCQNATDPITPYDLAIIVLAAFRVFDKLDSDTPFSSESVVFLMTRLFPRSNRDEKTDEVERRKAIEAMHRMEYALLNEIGWNPMSFRENTIHGQYRKRSELLRTADIAYDVAAAERASDLAQLDERTFAFDPTDVAMFILSSCSEEPFSVDDRRVFEDGEVGSWEYVVPEEVERTLEYVFRPFETTSEETETVRRNEVEDLQSFEMAYSRPVA